jgi:hypothetical protein
VKLFIPMQGRSLNHSDPRRYRALFGPGLCHFIYCVRIKLKATIRLFIFGDIRDPRLRRNDKMLEAPNPLRLPEAVKKSLQAERAGKSTNFYSGLFSGELSTMKNFNNR